MGGEKVHHKISGCSFNWEFSASKELQSDVLIHQPVELNFQFWYPEAMSYSGRSLGFGRRSETTLMSGRNQ